VPSPHRRTSAAAIPSRGPVLLQFWPAARGVMNPPPPFNYFAIAQDVDFLLSENWLLFSLLTVLKYSFSCTKVV